MDQMLELWDWPFLWRRGSTRTEGAVWMVRGQQRKHALIQVSADLDRVDAGQAVSFVKECCVVVKADYAFIHSLTPTDVSERMDSGAVLALDRNSTRFDLMVTTKLLMRHIPMLFWGNVFGTPYVDLFGRDLVLSTPAYRVEQLSDGSAYVQLTDKIQDLHDDPERIAVIRNKVMDHLGRSAFYDPEADPCKEYEVPLFWGSKATVH
jgi:hypothetical protein